MASKTDKDHETGQRAKVPSAASIEVTQSVDRGSIDKIVVPENFERSPDRNKLAYCEQIAKRLEPWIAIAAFVIGLGIYIVEQKNRTDERRVRAWQLVTTDAPGNSGKIVTLEYLVSIQESLTYNRHGVCLFRIAAASYFSVILIAIVKALIVMLLLPSLNCKR